MANVKISNLTAATTPVAGTEVLPIVQSGATVKASIANVQTATYSGGTANGVAYLNGSKVLTTGSALVFDGTNLGLGVTPPTFNTGRALSIYDAGSSLWSNSNGALGLVANAYYNSGWKYQATGAAARMDVGNANGTTTWAYAASGSAGAALSWTTAMTLDASGNLLVGTTTANANFYVYNAPVSYAGLNATAIFSSSASQSTGTGGLIAFEGKYTSGGAIANFAAIGGLKENSTDNNYSGYLGFYTRSNGSLAAERARIDSSGNLLIGASSFADGSNVFRISGSTISSGSSTTGSRTRLEFNSTGSGTVGSISTSGSVTSYNVTSDQRLKENIQDADSASSLIDSLKVRKFNWKSDNSHQRYGFVAQELVTVAPEAVYQPDDAEAMMAVDYSKLVPMLVKEIQSLRKRLAALESA